MVTIHHALDVEGIPMRYELWHVTSRNLLEEFETESDALDAVREYVEANEPSMVQELAVSAVPSEAAEVHAALPPTLAGDALAKRVGSGTSGRRASSSPGDSRRRTA